MVNYSIRIPSGVGVQVEYELIRSLQLMSLGTITFSPVRLPREAQLCSSVPFAAVTCGLNLDFAGIEYSDPLVRRHRINWVGACDGHESGASAGDALAFDRSIPVFL